MNKRDDTRIFVIIILHLLPSGHRNHNVQPVYNHDASIHNNYIYNVLCSINTLQLKHLVFNAILLIV